MTLRVLVVAGSMRSASVNTKLARVAHDVLSGDGVAVSFLDLRDVTMPFYDGDVETAEGLPEGAIRLRELISAHHALMVVSPEYNASIPPILKNAIDWTSRPHGSEAGNLPYRGKVAALLSASPGALGGLRGLVHLRQVLQNVGVLVLTEQFALARAGEAFAEDGTLQDPAQLANVVAISRRLVAVAGRLAVD